MSFNTLPRLTYPKWGLIAVIVYVLIFLGMRLVNLTELPTSIDEVRHIFRAQATINGDLLIGLRAGLKQLYIWLAALALLVVPDPVRAARVVSVLAGLGTVWVSYKLGQACYPDRRLGYLAALFYLISPFALFYDRLALTDSLLTMLTGAGILFSIQLWRHPAVKWAVLLGVVFGLAVFTKVYAAIYYPAPILLWLMVKRNISWRKIVTLMLVVYAVAFVAWLPIVTVGYTVYSEVYLLSTGVSSGQACEKTVDNVGDLNICRNSKEETPTPASNEESVGLPQRLLANLGKNLLLAAGWLEGYLTLPAIFLLAFSVLVIILNRDRLGLVLLILSLGWVLSLAFVFSIWYPRYLLPLIVPISIILALGVDNLAIYLRSASEKLAKKTLSSVSHTVFQVGIFLIIFSPYFSYDYLIITKPAWAPLPAKDRQSFIEGEFSGYGLKEAAHVIEGMAEQYPHLTVFRGSDSVSYAALNLYLQEYSGISFRDASAGVSLQELNALAREAPTLAVIISVVNAHNQFLLPDGSNLFDRTKYPHLWRLASFPKPGWYWTVDLYQWLSAPDMAVRWLQEGGDPDPRVAWQASETVVTVPDELLVQWPQAVDFESLQRLLSEAEVEYVLANRQLIDAQADLFEPYFVVDDNRLRLKQTPPGWQLALAYPSLDCELCLFQLRAPDYPVLAVFSERIQLQGFDLSATRLLPGQTLYVTLQWQGQAAALEGQQVLLRLVDENGNTAGQREALIFGGQLAGRGLEADIALADRHPLILDPNFPPGTYLLQAGLFDPASATKLSARSEQGQVVDEMVILTTVTIK